MLNSDQWLGRRFQLWDYSPSLSRLLIRSPKQNEVQFNIDLLFWGVKYLSIKTNLKEISIEVEQGGDDALKKFLIRSGDELHIVQATGYEVFYSEMEIFDSPLNNL
jgi:hypothetical protein